MGIVVDAWPYQAPLEYSVDITTVLCGLVHIQLFRFLFAIYQR
jgi:hypothetical protein